MDSESGGFFRNLSGTAGEQKLTRLKASLGTSFLIFKPASAKSLLSPSGEPSLPCLHSSP